MYPEGPPTVKRSGVMHQGKKMRHLVAVLSDDEAESGLLTHRSSQASSGVVESAPVWEREFNKYIHSEVEDELPSGMTLIKWWSVSAPVSQVPLAVFLSFL